MSVVVKAKIKEIAGSFNVAADFPDALDEEVSGIIKRALKRAEDNGRRTLMAKDL
jgi:histone H3/H4